ncbi:MAG: N-acetylmuramoyl-L-alanine amidase [Lachnospiraceae bacterium]|nr:N-acetylmuramoyl-L-alanine amidase [Lachnospiraceae bacterium]
MSEYEGVLLLTPKVVIDAGNGGSDTGVVYEGRYEKNDNLDLALAVGEILQANGINVEYTREDDRDQSELLRARYANESDAVLFVSFQRNASQNPNEGSGVQVIVYDEKSKARDLAENITKSLADIGFKNNGVTYRKDIDVLRKTKMPAMMVLTGYIDNDRDNELYDRNFNQIADAIADDIYEKLTGKELAVVPQYQLPPGSEVSESIRYRVQVGLFSNYNNATRAASRLKALGYPVDIVRKDPYYAVVVGEFGDLAEANDVETDLKMLGYDTLIIMVEV